MKNLEQALLQAIREIEKTEGNHTAIKKDEEASKRAGYDIFRSIHEYYNYICNLGDRLEVNLSNGETVNILFK